MRYSNAKISIHSSNLATSASKIKHRVNGCFGISADEQLVFPAMQREAPINLGQHWIRIRRKAALPDVRLHDLRHSFASVAIAKGIPLATIGKLLGHALPETTARYAHLADDIISESADRICSSLASALDIAA